MVRSGLLIQDSKNQTNELPTVCLKFNLYRHITCVLLQIKRALRINFLVFFFSFVIHKFVYFIRILVFNFGFV